jgi:hypothetical protein
LPAAASEPAMAFVACHCVQPGPEPLRVPQPGQPRCRHDERVVHGIRSVGRLAEYRRAKVVQRYRIPVIRRRESCGVACHDGRYNFPFSHIAIVVTCLRMRSEMAKITHHADDIP